MAVGYALLAKLGVLLAIPPSYATAVFPAAGVALAAVLLWGNAYALGVLIGSMAVTIWAAPSGELQPARVVLAAALGLAAAGQALVGAALVRKYVGFPTELQTSRATLLFLGLGGPVSSLVSASLGTLSIFVGGLLPASEIPFSWWTWWVGDSIGVLTFTPLVLIALASPRATWWRRRYSVALPLILAFGFEIVIFLFVSRTDKARQRQEFERYAATVTSAFREATEYASEGPLALRDLFDAHMEIGPEEFSVFARRYLDRRPVLRAVGWVLVVSDSERKAFEARASREEGKPFRITSSAADGSTIAAPRRPEYFPVRYVEKDDGIRDVLGVDVADDPLRREGVERARRTGVMAVSARMRLARTGLAPYGAIFVVPVFADGANADSTGIGPRLVRGYTVGLIDLSKAGDRALASIRRSDVTMTVEDSSAREGEQLLYASHNPGAGLREPAKGLLTTTSRLAIGGRIWTVRVAATPAYMTAHRSLQAWSALAGGLILTAGLGAFLLVLTGHAARVESLVAVRTRELTHSNDWLRREIVERERVEVDLRVAIDEAAMASRAKSDFLANMSHEIRTPMNGIVGMTGLLDTTALSAQQRECTDTIRQSADALLHVINDILDFSKIESGHVEFERADFDLDATVDDVLDTVALQATHKGIVLVGHVEPSVPRFVRGDAGRVRQILTNLVGNSVKFTPEGAVTVRVSIDAEDADSITLRFVVTDTGIGIPQHKMESLFSPFTQVDATTTRRFGGTGLGLSISRELARRMGGDVIARSRAGRGSTFSFSVKLCHADAPARRDDAPLHLPGSQVVIAHHSAEVRERLVALLESWDAVAIAVPDLAGLRTACDATRTGGPTIAIVESRLLGGEIPGVPERERLGRELGLRHLVLLAPINKRMRNAAANPSDVDAVVSEPVRRDRLRDALARLARGAHAGDAEATRRLVPRTVARVLVVEDNLVNQLVAARMIERLGHHVCVVDNGRDALSQLQSDDYDLVLMDCQMPELDGYDTTRVIRDPGSAVRRHDIAIVAMTANATADDRQRCLDAGMNDFLSKPVTLEAMTEVVEEWIGRLPTADVGREAVVLLTHASGTS